MLEKVGTWLRKQGYPLEMRVARELRSAGMSADLGTYYTDIETGRSRETDVLAIAKSTRAASLGIVQVCLVIECKSGGKPWVLLSGNVEHELSPQVRGMSRLAAPEGDWLMKRTGMGLVTTDNSFPLLSGYGPIGHSLVRPFGGDDSNGNREKDAAFAAMMSTAKAAIGVCHSLREQMKLIGAPSNAVVLPVLLVDAPLILFELDSSGEEKLSEIDRGTVVWHYDFGPQQRSSIITVVTPAVLPALAEDARSTAKLLRQQLFPG
ncbi:hypothetical protein AB0J48_02190 [Nocardia salmonicida]|uniref:hypothetical protein n=1 Tax=Nocardia salmonicida TaxID=53431 RepID=UPI0034471489